jgi:hypothetical protein
MAWEGPDVKPRTAGCVLKNMSRSLVCLIIAATVITSGCRRVAESDPVPGSLPGSYIYAAKGTTLKKPWEFSARLELTSDKHYAFTLDKTIDGQRDATETTAGTFAISGDHLILREAVGQQKNSQDLHKLLINSDSLIAEVGWTAELFLKGVGAPNIVFVKQRRG